MGVNETQSISVSPHLDEAKVEEKKVEENMQEEERSSFDPDEIEGEEEVDENWGQEAKKPHIHHLTTSSEKETERLLFNF